MLGWRRGGGGACGACHAPPPISSALPLCQPPPQDLVYLPISGLMGGNMKEGPKAGQADWYKVRWVGGHEWPGGICPTHVSRPAWPPRRPWPAAVRPPSVASVAPSARTWGHRMTPDASITPLSTPCPQGPTLFEVLDSIEPQSRDPYAPFRMPIIDRYRRARAEAWSAASGQLERSYRPRIGEAMPPCPPPSPPQGHGHDGDGQERGGRGEEG